MDKELRKLKGLWWCEGALDFDDAIQVLLTLDLALFLQCVQEVVESFNDGVC